MTDRPISRFHQPSAESVAELVARLKLTGDEPAVEALGGLPRACERFLNRHRNERDPIGSSAKHMQEAIEARNTFGLDSDGINHGGASSEVRRKVGAVWPGFWVGRAPNGSPICHFAVGTLNAKQLCQQISDEELRDFFLGFHTRGLGLQNLAHPPGTSSSGWCGTLEIFDLRGLSSEQLHLPGLLMLSKVLKLGAHLFCDNLGIAVVVNAPRIFHGAWSLLKRVLPPDTVAKVDIRADDGRDVLADLVGGADALDALLASRDDEFAAAQAGLFVLGVEAVAEVEEAPVEEARAAERLSTTQ